MTDEILMLDEDETLTLLRAGRTGTEPALVDVSAIAIAGGHRLRLRRRATQAAGAVVLAAAAGLAIVAGAPGLTRSAQPVVQPADRGTGDGGGATVVTAAETDVLNKQLFAAALGPDFRVKLAGADPQFATIELIPGSPAADRLPTTYTASTDFEVSSGFTQVDEPCNPADPVAATGHCEHRTLPDGSEVLSSTSRSEGGGPFGATTNVYFQRPDAHLVRTTLTAWPTDKDFVADPATRTAVLEWIHSFDDGLARAATDPRMNATPASTVAQTSDARSQDERNRDYLSEALGADWTEVRSNLETKVGEPAGLPAGYYGRARVDANQGGQPIEDFCTPSHLEQGMTCELRELPDGRKLVVQTQPPHYFTNGLAVASIAVIFVQPDSGDAIQVEVQAVNATTSASEPESVREQVTAWVATYEDELIRAATDLRIAPDTGNR